MNVQLIRNALAVPEESNEAAWKERAEPAKPVSFDENVDRLRDVVVTNACRDMCTELNGQGFLVWEPPVDFEGIGPAKGVRFNLLLPTSRERDSRRRIPVYLAVSLTSPGELLFRCRAGDEFERLVVDAPGFATERQQTRFEGELTVRLRRLLSRLVAREAGRLAGGFVAPEGRQAAAASQVCASPAGV